MRKSCLTIGAAALLLAACGRSGDPDAAPRAAPAEAEPVETEAPAGAYRLDKYHASLVFKVNHIGYSNYTGSFDNFDATLAFDPKAPEKMAVTATIDVGSLDIPAPPEGFLDELKGSSWLDAAEFPQMKFRSTKVTLTGPDTARVDGELELRGLAAPVAMDVTFNGGYAGFPPYDPNARIGFSAHGALKRSAFGVVIGIPSAENPVGVGDDVTFDIEAEFNGPPAQ